MTDDRAQFERERREAAARMAGDQELAKAALEVNFAADEHDWSYQWSWLGLPVIQMPTDIVALQEVIWETRPQLVIETGVARGRLAGPLRVDPRAARRGRACSG